MTTQSMKVVYALEKMPTEFDRAIYLAGPRGPSGSAQTSWRINALRILSKMGYDGVVFVPEASNGDRVELSDELIEWEARGLHLADGIVFWMPKAMGGMRAFASDDQWGTWKASGKAVWGSPWHGDKVKYQQHYAKQHDIPCADTLRQTLGDAIERMGLPALRTGTECEVPLAVWHSPMFQQWYQALQQAGNRLDGVKVRWSHWVKQGRQLFMCALHVNVYIAAEDRNKTNEVLVMRPDTMSVVLYHRPEGAQVMDTQVVMVKEFRAPGASDDGFVFELPSGSSFNPTLSLKEVAVAECHEEAGVQIDPDRLMPLGTRQLAATALTHRSHGFAASITEAELAEVHAFAALERSTDTTDELTHPKVIRLKEVINDHNIDWSNVGMMLSLAHSLEQQWPETQGR